jgi:endonuclease/exonuclease/phosphatase family metal-dependent hydrolase
VTLWNDRFRVLTWNIHAGIGPDRKYDLERIIALVRWHQPDIIALQEVDSRGRSHALPLETLKSALGHHAAEARTIIAPDGHYGHVLMSRWPMRTTMLHDLSVNRREPRFAIEANVGLPTGALTILATHLGLGYVECQQQVARLVDIVSRIEGRLILLGDFNDWHRLLRRAMRPLLPGRSNLKTFPARYPVLELDGIYWRPADAAISWWLDPAGRASSDHLPVLADFSMGDGETSA